MYRTTADENESTKGSKYVTYLKVDRDMYRGAWVNSIKKNAGKSKNDPAYENKYELKEDLKVPSRDELKKVFGEVYSDQKNRREAAKTFTDQALRRIEGLSTKEFIAQSPKSGKKIAKGFIDSFIEDFKNEDAEVVFGAQARGMTSPKVKNKVINILKSKGYNAMIDEYGVGARSPSGEYRKEGISPLIVFDGEKSLGKVETKKISKFTENNASSRFMTWYNYVNQYRAKDW
jgi:hypothetical protein